MTAALLEIIAPVQEEFNASPEWRSITDKAYPAPEVKKKVKKEKKLGTQFPGAKQNVEARPDGHVEGAGKDEVDLAKGAEDAMRELDVE